MSSHQPTELDLYKQDMLEHIHAELSDPSTFAQGTREQQKLDLIWKVAESVTYDDGRHVDSDTEELIKIYRSVLIYCQAALDKFNTKHEEFEAKHKQNPSKFETAYNASRNLCDELNDLKQQFTDALRDDNPTRPDSKESPSTALQRQYSAFKHNWQRAVSNSRPVLEQHRGVKQILVNLTLAVLGVGIGWLIGRAVNYRNQRRQDPHGGHGFFEAIHVQTRSEALLDEANDAVEQPEKPLPDIFLTANPL